MSCKIVKYIYFSKPMKLTNLLTHFYQILKKYFLAVEAARKFNVNAVDCSSVLRVTCPCCFVCVCDSFLCCISLLLSDSLSCVLNSVL